MHISTLITDKQPLLLAIHRGDGIGGGGGHVHPKFIAWGAHSICKFNFLIVIAHEFNTICKTIRIEVSW